MEPDGDMNPIRSFCLLESATANDLHSDTIELLSQLARQLREDDIAWAQTCPEAGVTQTRCNRLCHRGKPFDFGWHRSELR